MHIYQFIEDIYSGILIPEIDAGIYDLFLLFTTQKEEHKKLEHKELVPSGAG
jgi:hypothetical protein